MSDVWYYADQHGKVGPVTLQKLKESLATFQNAKDVLVWYENYPNWVLAGDVPELRAQTAAPPPLPTTLPSASITGTQPTWQVKWWWYVVGFFCIFGVSAIGNRVGRDEMARISAVRSEGRRAKGQSTMSWKKNLAYGAIITLIAVGYRVWSEYAGPRFDEGLQQAEAEMKKTLPSKVDEDTTLVDVKYEPTKTAYWYVVDTTNSTVDTHNLEQGIRTKVCASTEMLRTIKEKGFSYEYHYVNKARAVLADINITKCP
jgi:hypothetical protein